MRDRLTDGFGAREGILREDKAIRGPLSTREMEQLATNLTMLERGLRFDVPATSRQAAVTLQVERVVYDCVYPSGVEENRETFIRAMLVHPEFVLNVRNDRGEQMPLKGEAGIFWLSEPATMRDWLYGNHPQ